MKPVLRVLLIIVSILCVGQSAKSSIDEAASGLSTARHPIFAHANIARPPQTPRLTMCGKDISEAERPCIGVDAMRSLLAVAILEAVAKHR